MALYVLLFPALLFFIAIVQRCLFRFFFKDATDFDTYAHIYRVNHLRNYRKSSKASRPKDPLLIKKRFVEDASTNDPFLILKIVSYFPESMMPFLERYFNAFVDSIYTVIVYFCLYWFSHNAINAFLAALIYIFTPIFFTVQSTGPRTKAFTPRMSAEVFGSLALILLFCYLTNHNYIFFIIAALFGALAMMSNGFAAQTMFLIPIISSLLLQNISLFFFPVIAFCFALILGGGNFYRVFCFHFKYMGWYFIKNLHKKTPLTGRNSIIELFRAFKSRKSHAIYQQFFSRNCYLIVLIKMPIAYVALGALIHSYNVFSYVSIFILSGFIVFVITSTRYFLSIGEAERYLHYVYFFILLAVLKAPFFVTLAIVLVIYGVFFQVLDVIWYVFYRKKTYFDPSPVFDYLNKKNDSVNVLVVPDSLLNGWAMLSETNCNWLWPIYWSPRERALFNQYLSDFGCLDISCLKNIVSSYTVDVIVLDGRKFSGAEVETLLSANNYKKSACLNNAWIFEKAEGK